MLGLTKKIKILLLPRAIIHNEMYAIQDDAWWLQDKKILKWELMHWSIYGNNN